LIFDDSKLHLGSIIEVKRLMVLQPDSVGVVVRCVDVIDDDVKSNASEEFAKQLR
jgi:hypothetical protein